MPKYEIYAPASCHVRIEVEAANEEEAFDKALDATCGHVLPDFIENFEIHKRVGRGNICEWAAPWSMEVTPLDDDE
jgi:hypothetical protein